MSTRVMRARLLLLCVWEGIFEGFGPEKLSCWADLYFVGSSQVNIFVLVFRFLRVGVDYDVLI